MTYEITPLSSGPKTVTNSERRPSPKLQERLCRELVAWLTWGTVAVFPLLDLHELAQRVAHDTQTYEPVPDVFVRHQGVRFATLDELVRVEIGEALLGYLGFGGARGAHLLGSERWARVSGALKAVVDGDAVAVEQILEAEAALSRPAPTKKRQRFAWGLGG